MSTFSNMMNPVCGLSGPATITTELPQYVVKTAFMNDESRNLMVRIFTASFDWTWNIFINGEDFEIDANGYADLTALILSRTSDLSSYWDISIYETTAEEAQASNTNPSRVSLFPAWLAINAQEPADTFRVFTEDPDETPPFYQWLYGDYLGIDPANESLAMEIVAHEAQKQIFIINLNGVDRDALINTAKSFTFGRPAGGTFYIYFGGSDPSTGTEGRSVDYSGGASAADVAAAVATQINNFSGVNGFDGGTVYSPDAGILVVEYEDTGVQTAPVDIDTGLTITVTQTGSA